jgi:hypothetical protein
VVADDSPTGLAAIISAIVNPSGADHGRESVTILNTSAQLLDLSGWTLRDDQDRGQSLSGRFLPSETITIPLAGGGLKLNNQGGAITLLDPRGLKVDGVAYTAGQAREEGRPILFR